MILVHEDSRSRGFWKLAKVESLTTGADGLTRGAVVKVAFSVRRPTVLRHPLQLLYPLEVHQCDGDVMLTTDDAQRVIDAANDDADTVTGSEPRRHSNHVTSRNAREFIRLQSEDSNSSQATESIKTLLLDSNYDHCNPLVDLDGQRWVVLCSCCYYVSVIVDYLEYFVIT